MRKLKFAVLTESWNQKRRGLFVFEIRFAEAQFEFEFLKVFEEKGMGGDQAQRSGEQDEGQGGSEGEGKEIEAERRRVARNAVSSDSSIRNVPLSVAAQKWMKCIANPKQGRIHRDLYKHYKKSPLIKNHSLSFHKNEKGMILQNSRLKNGLVHCPH